jgi:hypothetical protein
MKLSSEAKIAREIEARYERGDGKAVFRRR